MSLAIGIDGELTIVPPTVVVVPHRGPVSGLAHFPQRVVSYLLASLRLHAKKILTWDEDSALQARALTENFLEKFFAPPFSPFAPIHTGPRTWEEILRRASARDWRGPTSYWVKHGTFEADDCTRRDAIFHKMGVEAKEVDQLLRGAGASGTIAATKPTTLPLVLAMVAAEVAGLLLQAVVLTVGLESLDELRAQLSASQAVLRSSNVQASTLKRLLGEFSYREVAAAYKGLFTSVTNVHHGALLCPLLPPAFQSLIVEHDRAAMLQGKRPLAERFACCDLAAKKDEVAAAELDEVLGGLFRLAKAAVSAKVHAVTTAEEEGMVSRVAALEAQLQALQVHSPVPGAAQQQQQQQQRQLDGQLAGQQQLVHGGGVHCLKCGGVGHIKAACAQYTCGGCNRTAPGHTWPNCPNPVKAFTPRK